MVVSLYLLFEVLAVIYCIHCLYNEKIKINFITVGIVLVEVIWMQSIYYNHWNNNLSWLFFPFIVIYCGIRFGFNIKAIFVNNVLWIVLVSVLQVGIMLFIAMVFGVSSIGEKESLIINIVIFLIFLVCLKKLRVEKWSKALQSNEKVIAISSVVIVIALIYFYVNYRTDKGTSIVYYAILLVSLMLIVVATIDIGKHKVKAKEIEAELRLHKLYEESFRNLIDEIRAKQHEFDNHINAIYSQHYLCHSYDELVEAQNAYCKKIVQDNRYNKLLSRGNPIVLGFLYSKFTEANKLGIYVEYKINIGDMKSKVPMHKIIELLGNLINNAVEALTEYEELNQMRVAILEQTHEIAINVSNECKNIDYEKIQNFFKKGYSEKGEKRGYGLYNVKKICEEYNIVMESTIKKKGNIDWLNYMLIINKKV